ncbi:MAG: hypothetical protein LBU23_07460 [Planctomycetota bacterium]|jgi:PAS domain-containing protein|nr:hypothetical protein [Planctomycetota bacterium]
MDVKPRIWVIDSERKPLAESLAAFADWAEALYIGPEDAAPDWENHPDGIFFSAELAGGAGGEDFAQLAREAEGLPLIAVAGYRSLAQALAFFRAGAGDYLSVPLDADEARRSFTVLLERAGSQALRRLILAPCPDIDVDVEPQPDAAGGVQPRENAGAEPQEEDILARLDQEEPPAPGVAGAAGFVSDHEPAAERPLPGEEEAAGFAPAEEPEAVDGLPISTLWEEMPCGILVFDSGGALAFSNSLGLSLFGYALPEALGEALDRRRGSFAAHTANGKPLADNQWPQVLALRARAARSAVLSIVRPDGRRLWLRIDCLPHLADGEINRLGMTIVNLTGEIPAFVPAPAPKAAGPGKAKRSRKARRKN